MRNRLPKLIDWYHVNPFRVVCIVESTYYYKDTIENLICYQPYVLSVNPYVYLQFEKDRLFMLDLYQQKHHVVYPGCYLVELRGDSHSSITPSRSTWIASLKTRSASYFGVACRYTKDMQITSKIYLLVPRGYLKDPRQPTQRIIATTYLPWTTPWSLKK